MNDDTAPRYIRREDPEAQPFLDGATLTECQHCGALVMVGKDDREFCNGRDAEGCQDSPEDGTGVVWCARAASERLAIETQPR